MSEYRIFSDETRAAFTAYLRENPKSHRVTAEEKDIIVDWLTNSDRKPTCQQEYNRRNYVQKTFAWNPVKQRLSAVPTKVRPKRKVVTTNKIFKVVQRAHRKCGHRGWDGTFSAIKNKYYGIIQTDVIFLVKRCELCAQVISKSPRGCNRCRQHRCKKHGTKPTEDGEEES